ncbi:hypothetical protein EAH_00045350 [Eimeria acervulina]|uniref:Uncharacterized protein n=1 Tax=Eimeria acervulina TaxID=5801 RepID=U6GHR3_EIMAC|nr:hypothetical protein EAH_00045350 [Eimeria acervulina]CDI79710.1 hypothetical protein EAH_00045350 [Eimeria acervulina]
MLHAAAATFEQMQILTSQGFQDEVHSPPSKFFRLDESWQPTSHPSVPGGRFGSDRSSVAVGSGFDAFSADAWVANDFGSVLGEGGQQGHAAGASGMQGLQREVPAYRTGSSDIYEAEVTAKQRAVLSVGSATSSEDALNAEAWLDYHSANMYPQALQHRVIGTSLQNPTVDATSPDSTDEGSFGTDRRTGIVGRRNSQGGLRHDSAVPLIQMKTVQQLESQAQAFEDTLGGVGRSVSIPALRAPNSDPGEPSKGGDVRLHPFVRLPVVNPRDIRRRFRAEFALLLRFPRQSPMESYTTMRSLFAKASLTPEEIQTLIREAELVACYANDKLTRPLKRRRANYLFVKLSSIFMAFDHLVRTIELLGEKMNTGSWWAQFVQRFHTDYCFSERGRNERTEMLNKLVNRLSAALSIYKGGRRPAFTEIIELKRAIISHAYKRTQLSNPLWKLWMDDDNKFSSSSNGPKDPSVGEVPGHREASTL